VEVALAQAEAKIRAKVLPTYQGNLAGYIGDILGEALTPKQEEIAQSIDTNRRTVVLANHSAGKTHLMARALSYWFDCWPDAHIGMVTAPTWHQSLNLCFAELKRIRLNHNLNGVPPAMTAQMLDSGLLRDSREDHEMTHLVRALNAERQEGIQGEHKAPLFIVVEEAPGVPRYIFEGIQGLMTHPDCVVCLIGNPTSKDNYYGEASDNPMWNVIQMTTLEHPNILAEMKGLPPPFPDAVRAIWLWEMIKGAGGEAAQCEIVRAFHTLRDNMGEDQVAQVALENKALGDQFTWYHPDEILKAANVSQARDKGASEQWIRDHLPWPDLDHWAVYKPNADFQSRVLGMFPSQPDEQVVPMAWYHNCEEMWPLVPAVNDPVEVGMDCARFGSDRTGIAGRWGPCVMNLKVLRQMDTRVAAGQAIELTQDLAAITGRQPDLIPIKVDVGGLGAGVVDNLVAEGYNAIEVNSSSTAIEEARYPNRRSELWFTTRQYIYQGEFDISRLELDLRREVKREVTSPRYKMDSKSRRVVEDKAAQKKRVGRSPDLADTINLCFAGIDYKAQNWVDELRRRYNG
jgi:hypothetical protein